MYKGVAVFSETVKTDSRLTVFGLVSAVEMKNSLENLCNSLENFRNSLENDEETGY